MQRTRPMIEMMIEHIRKIAADKSHSVLYGHSAMIIEVLLQVCKCTLNLIVRVGHPFTFRAHERQG